MVRAHMVLIAVLACAACKPELEGRRSLVEGPRVLAVRSTPASGKPSVAVSYDALYVDFDGPLDPEPLDWALCTERKGLAESGSIAGACLQPSADELEGLGNGASVTASVPMDACSLFGPTPQTPEEGEAASRPVDPDTTGGYYQPVRVMFPQEQYAVGVTRLSCGLGGATQEQSAEFTRKDRPNENPELESVVLKQSGDDPQLPAFDSDEVLEVPHGKAIELIARWPTCPEEDECGDGICGQEEDVDNCREDCREPRGCKGSEPYVWYDPVTRELHDRREAMRVSWFASAGLFDHDRTGRTEEDADENETSNVWISPAKPGEVRIWAVLRDDRGGVGWGSYKLQVK